MRIYTKVVIAIDSGEILEESGYDYDGPVALCGGGSSGPTYDKEYNKRMANLYENEFAMAQEYSNFWKGLDANGRPILDDNGVPVTSYADVELAQQAANAKLIPAQTNYQLASLNAAGKLIDPTTDLSLKGIQTESQRLGLASNVMGAQKDLIPKLMGATEVNASDVAARGVADVNQAFRGAAGGYVRDVSRTGAPVNMSSLNAFKAQSALDKAKAIGSVKSDARKYADEETFRRMQTASTVLGGMA